MIETDVLGPIDGHGATVHRRLTADRTNPAKLTAQERRHWATFLVAQFHRDAHLLTQLDTLAVEATKRRLAELRAAYRGRDSEATMEGILKDFFDGRTAMTMAFNRSRMVERISDPAQAELIDSLTWITVHIERDADNPNAGEFMTTDRPLLVNGGDPSDPVVRELVLALSPTALFLAVPKSAVPSDSAKQAYAAAVAATHNFAMMRSDPRSVYSRRDPRREGTGEVWNGILGVLERRVDIRRPRKV